jgi:hypothetical protein
MSSLGKIFLYLAAAGAAVALIIGYFLITDYSANRQTLETTQTNLATTQKQEASAEVKLTASQKDDADAHTSLTDANTKIDTLNTQLADAQAKAGDAAKAVQDAKDAATKDQAQLDAINSTLKGQKPEDVMAQVDKLTNQIADDTKEQKILEDQLQAANKSVADLKVAVNAAGQKPAPMPPGLSGKVTFVNTPWNFVVLNIGLSNGVVPNGELIIYRGREFLGKVKVTSAEDNTAVADILPGAKDEIRPGDDVLN